MEKVNFAEKLGLFDDRWAPKIVAQMNDVHFKLAKVEGSFVWHEHGDTDEVFIVVDGTLCIEFEDQTVTLETGEMLVVPKGTRHRPYAEATCSILLVEPTGVYHAQTGIKHSDGVRGGWPYRSANPVSHDEATQDRLWDLSETLVTELKA